jgi:hypothetical protein
MERAMGKTFAIVAALVGCLGAVGCDGDVDEEDETAEGAEPHPWAEEAGFEDELTLDERRNLIMEKDFAAPQEHGEKSYEAEPKARPLPAVEEPLPTWDDVAELVDDSGPV